MQKTMVYLDEDVHRRLRYLALDERISMAELIRRAVEQYLKKRPDSTPKRKAVQS
jgi:predicted HicB family RNase H-like nuclease